MIHYVIIPTQTYVLTMMLKLGVVWIQKLNAVTGVNAKTKKIQKS